MLAQNFKTAADLGISEEQKDALMKTLVLLETGKLKHTSIDDLEFDLSDSLSDNVKSFTGHFNMTTFGTRHKCGTAACIAGTDQLISGVRFIGRNRPDELENLFYMTEVADPSRAMEETTPVEAATALRSYLTTGHARWDLALAS